MSIAPDTNLQYHGKPLTQDTVRSIPTRKSTVNTSTSEKPKNVEQQSLPPFAPRKSTRRGDFDVIDKIEIDSDNIETPPATRKVLSYMKINSDKSTSRPKDDEETLGDGQFDRFSSARRTRRYRKSQDDDSPKSEFSEAPIEKQISRPTTLKVKPTPVDPEDPENKEIRLKHWQDKLNGKVTSDVETAKTLQSQDPATTEAPKKEITRNKIPVLQSGYIRNSRLSATLPYSFKSRTLLNSNSKSPPENCRTDEPNSRLTNIRPDDKDASITQVNSSFIPEIKVRALTPTKSKMEHDLHDEGFEETQSLISDSPSQTTSSGYNYDIDNVDSPSPSMLNSSSDSKQIIFNRTDSSGSGDATSGCDSRVELLNRQNKLALKGKPENKVSLLPKRTSSMRLQKQPSVTSSPNEPNAKMIRSSSAHRSPTHNLEYNKFSSAIQSTGRTPRYAKENAPSQIKSPSPVKAENKNPIQRYPSKSSLKSSRSSLNSCASVSTVKNVKSSPKIDNYSKVIKSLATLQKASRYPNTKIKKPLTPVQVKSKGGNSAAPSRSSSSASSSETGTRRNGSLTLSTSFKENSADQLNKLCNNSSQSFMRPTASSSAKDMTDTKPKLIVRTPFK